MKTRKRVTITELATYFGVSRPTIIAWKNQYNAAFKNKYDSTNIYSVFDFFKYLLKEKI